MAAFEQATLFKNNFENFGGGHKKKQINKATAGDKPYPPFPN